MKTYLQIVALLLAVLLLLFFSNKVTGIASKIASCTNGTKIVEEQLCDGIIDCEDESDENFTMCIVRPPTCAKDEFRCANRRCISKSLQCTEEDDCGDLSDEMGCNLSGDCNDRRCAQGCTPRVANRIDITAYLCDCAQGYRIGHDHHSCVDIDECASFHMHQCQQLCVNEAGSYDCECHAGFLTSHSRCLVKGSPAAIVYAMRTNLMQMIYEKFTYFYHGVTNIRALDIDPVEKVLYWVDSDGKLKRSLVPKLSHNAPTSGKEQVLSQSDMTTTGLSIDWVARNLYWSEMAPPYGTNTGTGHIQVTTLDGRYTKVLISDNVQSPTAIAVAPERGQMVWTDAGCTPRLEKAWMDGKHRRILVYTDIVRPTGVTIDFNMNNRIFWCDNVLSRIESINLDGSDRVIVSTGEDLQNPFRLDVAGPNLYWSTMESHKILRQDKFGRRSKITLATHVGRIYDFRVFQTLKYNLSVYNPCPSKPPCSHLCLLNPKGATCDCPEGTRLRYRSIKQCEADHEPERVPLERCSCRTDQVCKVDVMAHELYCI